MEILNSVIFYNLDESIKTYRMYAQNQLKINNLKITIDQWLVLKSLKENPTTTQIELAEKVFKDNASITRIIDLLVKANYLQKNINQNDKRKSNLKITKSGNEILVDVYQIVLQNRAKAHEGITQEEIEITNRIVKKIASNCKK